MPILIAALVLAAAAAAPAPPPADSEVSPVDVTAPKPTHARSHAQVVADRWSPHIVTCKTVFVQRIGVTRQACATNREWEVEAQRIRHEFMQEQWRMLR